MDQEKAAAFTAEIQALPFDALGHAYADIGEQIDTIKKSIQPKVAAREERQKLIMFELRRRMTEEGTNSTTVSGLGNFHFRTVTQVSCGDWALFYAHCATRLKEGTPLQDVMGALTKKVKAEYVQTWMLAHNNVPPPGINLMTEKKLFFVRAAT